MSDYQFIAPFPRTDLALELAQPYLKSGKLPRGLRVHTRQHGAVEITCVQIDSLEAAQQLHKPCGKYITIQTPPLWNSLLDPQEEIDAAADSIRQMLPSHGGILVVGLGNPESKYDTTRHNAGFMAIDHIAAKVGCKVNQLKFKSLCGLCELEGKKVMLLKPTTYMNSSGEAVREASQFYKIPPEKIIVIFDDVSLDVGKMRIRRKGSDGGHNGIKSIIYLTGSDQYPRIKVGVGKKPRPDYDLAAWVLGHFSDEDLKALQPVFDHCYDAVREMLKGNIDRAMNLFN